jgi:hypothetical protein
MSAVRCVKCNFSTIILLKAHDKFGVAPPRIWQDGMTADEGRVRPTRRERDPASDAA